MRHTILLIAQVFAVSTVLVACDRVEDADTKDEESSTEASGGGSVAGAGAGVGGGATASVATRITVPAGITDDYVNVKAVAPNAAPQAPNGEKVLIIVANDGFYFKEYSDPRVELEAAGYTVVVAAATTPTALPHPNSGQLSGDGRTTVDLALADVVATDYVALVVAGGWGASNYYFGYEGKIDEARWAQKTTSAALVSDLVSAFVKADKPVAGICNGVLVLAWARVDGKSPLDGKTVAAPDGGAPAQTYLGKHYADETLVMSTFAADNGATVTAPYSIGVATTATDDVVVDGKIITAQNQYAAQQAGKRLVAILVD